MALTRCADREGVAVPPYLPLLSGSDGQTETTSEGVARANGNMRLSGLVAGMRMNAPKYVDYIDGSDGCTISWMLHSHSQQGGGGGGGEEEQP